MDTLPSPARRASRRDILRALGSTAAFAAFPSLRASTSNDSLALQFHKSLTEEQHAKIVLPRDHPKRGYVSNWWYICLDQRLHTFYPPDPAAEPARV